MTVDNYITALEKIRTGAENLRLALSEVIGALKAEKFKAQREERKQKATEEKPLLIVGKEISAFEFSEKEILKMPKHIRAYFKAGKIRAGVRLKNGNVHEIRCSICGREISASSKNFEVAKKKFVAKLDEILSPKEIYGSNYQIPFEDYADKWLEIKRRTTKPSTFNEYERMVNRDLKPQFKGRLLHEITRSMVQSYLFTKVDAGKLRTAHKLQLTLHCIFDLAEVDFNIPSPMKRIVLPNYEKERGVPLTLAEEKQLVEFCKKGGTATSAFLVILYFGLRRSEVQTLTVGERAITVVTSKQRLGRNEVLRTIPFTPVFERVLPYVDFEKAKKTNINTIYTAFKRLFPHKHPHELRYTFISRCKECGVNPEVVMLWSGHEEDKDVISSRVNRRYTVFSQEFLTEEAKKVDYTLDF